MDDNEYAEIMVQTKVEFRLKIKRELAKQMTHEDVAETVGLMIDGIEYINAPAYIDSVQYDAACSCSQSPQFDMVDIQDYEIVSIDHDDFPKIEKV